MSCAHGPTSAPAHARVLVTHEKFFLTQKKGLKEIQVNQQRIWAV